MHVHLRRTLTLSVSALALLCAPIFLGNSGLAFIPDTAALAGNGNGNGGDNGNGGGNGNGGNGGNGGGGGSDHGNSGGNGNSGGGSDNASVSHGSSGNGGGNSGSRGKKSVVETDGVETASVGDSPAGKERNLKAQLGGLNSLKRNINGLMNSSDPRMDGIREFIVASAELEEAREAATTANDAFLDAKGDYLDFVDGLGLDGYPDLSPAALQDALDAIVIPEDNPETEEVEGAELIAEKELLEDALAKIEESGLWTALVDASELAEGAAGDLADAEAAAGEDDLKGALLMAANANRRSDAYLTDDIMDWANDVLGVGAEDGLIDDYVARQD